MPNASLPERLHAAPTTPRPVAEDEIVEPARVAALLRRAHDRRSLLTVALAGSDELYVSALLEVVTTGRYVVLDELKPESGHALAVRGRRIHVSTRLDGIRLGFESVIGQVNIESGVPYYKVPFPQVLHYHQRRAHHRAPVPIEQPLSVQLVTANARTLTGELRDLSSGGLSVRLDPGGLEQLAVGDLVPRCVIQTAAGGRLCAPVEICYAERFSGMRRPRIGGRFVGLEPRTARALEALVAELDRAAARRLARAG